MRLHKSLVLIGAVSLVALGSVAATSAPAQAQYYLQDYNARQDYNTRWAQDLPRERQQQLARQLHCDGRCTATGILSTLMRAQSQASTCVVG